MGSDLVAEALASGSVNWSLLGGSLKELPASFSTQLSVDLGLNTHSEHGHLAEKTRELLDPLVSNAKLGSEVDLERLRNGAMELLATPGLLEDLGGLLADFFNFTGTRKQNFTELVEDMPVPGGCATSRKIAKALPREYKKNDVVCIGHSRGAWLLTAYAKQLPDNCGWVVLLGSPGQLANPTQGGRVIDVIIENDPIVDLRSTSNYPVQAHRQLRCPASRHRDNQHSAKYYRRCLEEMFHWNDEMALQVLDGGK